MYDTPARLLVVDDDKTIQTLMAAIFGRYGMAVDAAGDGRSALERLRRVRYDAVVLDLMLPEPNGFDILRELKSFDRGLLSRTVVLTAMSRQIMDQFEDRTAVKAVKYKPFELYDLIETVLSCSTMQSAHDPGRRQCRP